MAFTIEITADARVELVALPAHAKRPIADAIDQQLVFTPLDQTRNRKELRDEVTANFVFVPPMWEVRVGDYRIFYDVDEIDLVVTVRAVRRKLPGLTTDEVLHE